MSSSGSAGPPEVGTQQSGEFQTAPRQVPDRLFEGPWSADATTRASGLMQRQPPADTGVPTSLVLAYLLFRFVPLCAQALGSDKSDLRPAGYRWQAGVLIDVDGQGSAIFHFNVLAVFKNAYRAEENH